MLIKINDLFPFLRPGWVAMDGNGEWHWYEDRPALLYPYWLGVDINLSKAFNIAPFDGFVEDSLIQV